MPNNQRPLSFFDITLYVTNFLIPRLLGLVPVSMNYETLEWSISKFWHLVCVLVGSAFLFFYPMAIYKIVYNVFELPFSSNMVVSAQIAITYLLTVQIYFIHILYPNEMQEYSNESIDFYYQTEKSFGKVVPLESLVIEFVIRAIYSYAGQMISNYVRLLYVLRNGHPISVFYQIIYFLPDATITSTGIRFHSAIILQINYNRQINVILEKCAEKIKTCMDRRMSYKRKRLLWEVSEEIDRIMEQYISLRARARLTERMLSKVLVLSIIYGFINITSGVSFTFKTEINCQWSYLISPFSTAFFLVFIFESTTANG